MQANIYFQNEAGEMGGDSPQVQKNIYDRKRSTDLMFMLGL